VFSRFADTALLSRPPVQCSDACQDFADDFLRCFSRFAGTNRMIQTGLRVAVSALIIDARSSCGSVWFSAALLTPLVHDNDVFHRSSLDRQEHLPVISSC